MPTRDRHVTRSVRTEKVHRGLAEPRSEAPAVGSSRLPVKQLRRAADRARITPEQRGVVRCGRELSLRRLDRVAVRVERAGVPPRRTGLRGLRAPGRRPNHARPRSRCRDDAASRRRHRAHDAVLRADRRFHRRRGPGPARLADGPLCHPAEGGDPSLARCVGGRRSASRRSGWNGRSRSSSRKPGRVPLAWIASCLPSRSVRRRPPGGS
jgi:hypothetical protein